eukprot:scaffold75078_cov30-Phaeocystis_antarctica.AAC.2
MPPTKVRRHAASRNAVAALDADGRALLSLMIPLRDRSGEMGIKHLYGVRYHALPVHPPGSTAQSRAISRHLPLPLPCKILVAGVDGHRPTLVPMVGGGLL